jgi:flagellar motility protein MotE (MotC chaperone)
MKLIRMNSLSKVMMCLLIFGIAVEFSNVLAGDDDHKTEENESKEGLGHTEAKGEKVLGHSKVVSTHEAKSKSKSKAKGHNDLTQGTECLVDNVVLDDLKRAKEELDERNKDIASKEAELKAREKAISEELQKLEKVRDDIAHNGEQKAKENQARVTKLVETFLTMSPKSAAKVLAGLDDSLAVLSISQMDTLRLAKIMNNMDPRRSSHLSELLAGVKKHTGQVAVKKGGG